MGRPVHVDADRALLLVPLVRFDARRDLVFVIDLDRSDLVSFDAALAVHEGDVVVLAGAKHRAHDLRRARAVALHADHDVGFLGLGGRGREQTARRHHQRSHDG